MTIRILVGDARAKLAELPDESVHCVVTSPPYFGLRDYGVEGQIGLEPTPAEFVAVMVEVFREVRRVMRHDATLWLNLGDSYSSGGRTTQVAPTLRGNGKDEASGKQAYLNNFAVRPGNHAGFKPKDLIGIPWRVAFALQADGWYLRQDIIWSKPNPMPESVTDRCTKAHEYLFLLSKSARYHYDAEAIKEPLTDSSIARLSQDVDGQAGSARVPGKTNGRMKAVRSTFREGTYTRNKRSVWEVATAPFKEAHFATFPPDLIEPCIKAGCPKGGTVLDPFGGAGTTGLVADRLQRDAILIELNPEYAELARGRIKDDAGMFAEVAT